MGVDRKEKGKKKKKNNHRVIYRRCEGEPQKIYRHIWDKGRASDRGEWIG